MLSVQSFSPMRAQSQLITPFSLEFPEGSITTILGANGVGKSTLLACIAGLHQAYHGEIYYADQNIAKLTAPAQSRMRTFLMQQIAINMPIRSWRFIEYGLYPWFPHQSHFGFGQDQSLLAKEQALMDFVSQEMDLAQLWDKDINRLSGGQRQRVNIARTLVQLGLHPEDDQIKPRCQLLLLDEPTSGLDLLYQQRLMKVLQLLAKKGITILMVLHDIQLACQYSNYVLCLSTNAPTVWGKTDQLINAEQIKALYGIDAQVFYDQQDRMMIQW